MDGALTGAAPHRKGPRVGGATLDGGLDRLQVRFHPGQVYFDVDRSQVDSDLVDRGVCRV